jgi:hypothetical protein
LGSHLLRVDLSFGELMSRGRQIRRFLVDEKARRNFRQLERPVRTHAVECSKRYFDRTNVVWLLLGPTVLEIGFDNVYNM